MHAGRLIGSATLFMGVFLLAGGCSHATRSASAAKDSSSVATTSGDTQSATQGAMQGAMQTTGAGGMAASAASDSAGWHWLFDGKSLAAFRGYKMDTMPSGWHIENGTLTKSGPGEDIITRDKYGDFELAFDWKIGTGGNSGVMYRVTEQYDHMYWSGPEYQLLDDAGHPDGKSRLTAAGSAYAVYPSPAGVVKPANQWNSSLIVVKGNHVEHWMNGQKLLEYDLQSPDWKAKVKASKFAAWPNYGLARTGYIGIQGDHDGVLALRNIKIRELK